MIVQHNPTPAALAVRSRRMRTTAVGGNRNRVGGPQNDATPSITTLARGAPNRRRARPAPWGDARTVSGATQPVGVTRRGRSVTAVPVAGQRAWSTRAESRGLATTLGWDARGTGPTHPVDIRALPQGGRQAMWVRRRTIAAVALIVGAAACTSSTAKAPVTTVLPPIPTVLYTNAPSTSSTTAASTVASGTTASVTSSGTTSVAVSAAEAKAAAEIRATLARSFADFRACATALPHCDTSKLADTRAGVLLERNVAKMTEWNAAGYVYKPGEYRVVVDKVTFTTPELTRATASVCSSSAGDLVNPGAGPGGADVIVDGGYSSGFAAWDMRLSDGVWRVYDAPATGTVSETSDVCPAG